MNDTEMLYMVAMSAFALGTVFVFVVLALVDLLPERKPKNRRTPAWKRKLQADWKRHPVHTPHLNLIVRQRRYW